MLSASDIKTSNGKLPVMFPPHLRLPPFHRHTYFLCHNTSNQVDRPKAFILIMEYIPTPEAALRILRAQSVEILIPLVVFLLGGLVFRQRRTVQQIPKQQEQEEVI